MLKAWELALVEECRSARLATVARDGRPHLVPVCYAYQEGSFVIAVDEKPKREGKLARVRNIERDSRVSLLVDRYDDDWERLAWVRADGVARVVDHGDSAPGALKALRDRYGQYRAMALEELPLIMITPERVVSWRWTGGEE